MNVEDQDRYFHVILTLQRVGRAFFKRNLFLFVTFNALEIPVTLVHRSNPANVAIRLPALFNHDINSLTVRVSIGDSLAIWNLRVRCRDYHFTSTIGDDCWWCDRCRCSWF
jgi:hypothetical protein